MTVTYTDTPVNVTVGPATLSGRVMKVRPLMPWDGDETGEANEYRIRNAGKEVDVHIWRGVRYAEPPVGARRFKPALDYDYPAGTFQLDEWGNVPVQIGGIEGGTTGRPETGPTVGSQNWAGLGTQESEDCLTLNIWRPVGVAPAGGWPVLVWTHGGGWTQNSALQPQWRGHRLCTKGIIVVTIEYRLGILGHFYHPDWEAEPDWEGPSFALTDVKSALRWVNRNIAAFGGDPAKVTLGGSSAGGECTLAMMEDTSTASLFRNAWAVSGGGLADRDPKTETGSFEGYDAFYDRLRRIITLSGDSLRDVSDFSRTITDAIAADGMSSVLRNSISISALKQLLNRRMSLTRDNIVNGTLRRVKVSDVNLYPWFGGGLVYNSAVDAAKAGAYDRNLIVSSAQNEASLLADLPDENDDAEVAEATATSQVNTYVRRLNVMDNTEWMRQDYTPEDWTNTQRRNAAYSQAIFQYPAWRIARAMKQTASATSWLALWNFTGSGRGTAGHSSDLPFIFGNVQWSCGGTGAEGNPNLLTERALRMSNCMQQVMANYVANNDPSAMYSNGTDLDLFETPGYFTLVPYDVALPQRWNVFGKNAYNAFEAPIECTHVNYAIGSFVDYEQRLENVATP